MAAGLLLCVLALPACTPALRKPETPTGPHFRLLTWNVNWPDATREQLLATIQDSEADVVCLQETTPEWERLALARLASVYPYSRLEQGNRGGGGIAIFSRYPTRSLGYMQAGIPGYGGWAAQVATPVGPVNLLNVHLPPATTRDAAPGDDPAARHQRFADIRKFARRLDLDSPTPAIVAGDFAEEPDGDALQYLVQAHDFTNSLGEFDRTSPTWTWRSTGMALNQRFDHVFYRGLYCFSSEVIPAPGSDHRPVVAVFGPSTK